MCTEIYKFKVSPYEELVKSNPIWIDKMIAEVKQNIIALEKSLIEESKYDKYEPLRDENFLYTRFKDNIETGCIFGNWEVLKYFIRIFKLKIYYFMIGENKFTNHDKEMFDYFNNIEITNDTKCKHSKIKWHNNEPQFDKWTGIEMVEIAKGVYESRFLTDYILEFTPLYTRHEHARGKRPLCASYYERFYTFFESLDNMVRHCKGLEAGWWKCTKLFDETNCFLPARICESLNSNDRNFTYDSIEKICPSKG